MYTIEITFGPTQMFWCIFCRKMTDLANFTLNFY